LFWGAEQPEPSITLNHKEKGMAKDPVCGMEVNSKTAQKKLEHKGKTYHFCTTLCMLTFQNDPEKYLMERKSDSKK
jgi:YHS domain-containing protein